MTTTIIIGRIARIHGASGGESARPSLVTYDVRDERGVVHEKVLPGVGRPVRNDEAEIYAASEGDLCVGFVSYVGTRRRVEWMIHEIPNYRTMRPIFLPPMAASAEAPGVANG